MALMHRRVSSIYSSIMMLHSVLQCCSLVCPLLISTDLAGTYFAYGLMWQMRTNA